MSCADKTEGEGAEQKPAEESKDGAGNKSLLALLRLIDFLQALPGISICGTTFFLDMCDRFFKLCLESRAAYANPFFIGLPD